MGRQSKEIVGAWVAVGVGVGAAFGVATKNMALCLVIGSVVGLAVGYLLLWYRSR